jgi:4-hydroxybenzoate polyprenyltransferase
MNAVLAAITFSITASVIYVINDFLDLDADRRHPRKCKRPLASGEVTKGQATGIITLLCILLIFLVWNQSWSARFWLLIYVVGTTAYSFRLKSLVVLDVVMLSLFYGLRVIYAGAVCSIVISVWTMVFCLFLFLSLAIVKRLSEIDLMESASSSIKSGRRPYIIQDRGVLVGMACASAYTAVLVVGLYLNSPEISSIHTHPKRLWLLLPALLYWLSRILIIVNRGEMHEDPVAFALRDKVSWLLLLWTILIMISAN